MAGTFFVCYSCLCYVLKKNMKKIFLGCMTAVLLHGCSGASGEYHTNHFASPDGDYFASASVNWRAPIAPYQGNVLVHLFDADMNELDTIGSLVSDESSWSFAWHETENIVILQSNDFEPQAWTINKEKKLVPILAADMSVEIKKQAAALKNKFSDENGRMGHEASEKN
jgi:hypothetical protein